MKYKLIKEYPNGPKLNSIYQSSNTEYYTNKSNTLHKDFIENYPEFWKLVVEKDYEILSLKYHNNIYNLAEKDIFRCKAGHIELTTFLANLLPNININSVKRLSDSEIFTVDDNTKYGCIDKFYIKNNHLLATTVLESNGRYLKDLEKLKQKLFTTEDGVDIFEGDTYFAVFNSEYVIKELKATKGQYINPDLIRFSTKEKAEEYILMNKPCLSYNEVLNAAGIRNKNTFDTLKKLIKSKIQQSV